MDEPVEIAHMHSKRGGTNQEGTPNEGGPLPLVPLLPNSGFILKGRTEPNEPAPTAAAPGRAAHTPHQACACARPHSSCCTQERSMAGSPPHFNCSHDLHISHTTAAVAAAAAEAFLHELLLSLLLLWRFCMATAAAAAAVVLLLWRFCMGHCCGSAVPLMHTTTAAA
eukprot:CAMPEP_0202368242 /NCGR_PEP_ID=MMETSP1127-20130417/397_1 /ASSEMBLY_ACC=CAM_ASM_000462 /TAXON_ID=3047 /ORGANISM="Dunaliella tertiolecta, Strain CCMP1320" /LENGTH=167 /DNA_ID=CAMNT_0048963633 /DNA_START=681 /DNA_END=1182 /DNA_ORIENTATION=-